jgi:hypothetical protein
MKKIFLTGVLVTLFGLVAVNAQTASVTFNCNMAVKICEMSFTPGTDSVELRGDFDGWGDGYKMESNEPGDSIWTITADFNVGDTIHFKFYVPQTGAWEDDPTRELIIPSGGTTYSDYFNRDSVCNPVGTGNVLFTVDMTTMQDVGIFDPNVDSVIISGSFNGWSTENNENTSMSQDPDHTYLWTKNYAFVNEPLNTNEYYKYVVIKADTNSVWEDGYERPLSQGGGNRDFIFVGDAQAFASVKYDDVHPAWEIPSGTNLEVTFSVDMTTATNPDSQAVPFVPGTDSVYWISEQPSFAATQGWNTNGRLRQVPMTQQGSSNIYEGTYTVQEPSFNSFEYRYAYVHSADSTFYYESAGFGDFAYRVRYVEMSAPNTFTNPFTFPQDSWTNATVKVNEVPPLGLDVKHSNEIAKDYRLSQNYPNPFNPTTTIKFSIPENNKVTIKVFNVLGQVVATLVNSEYKSGTYEVAFDASKLSSGIYFYRINAGEYQATKKMMLLK